LKDEKKNEKPWIENTKKGGAKMNFEIP
jgi:hypothetical protein